MGPATLRTASERDVDSLVALINTAFAVEQFFVDGDRVSRDGVAALFQTGTFLLAELDGTPVASLFVELRGDRAYVGMLAVHPAHQGRGHGRTMMDAAERRSRDAGCRAIDIRIVNLRTELPPFYERLGYVEHGTAPFVDPRLTRPCHFVLMEKVL